MPSYSDYIKRGQIVDGLVPLADMGGKLEQYFQDNRTYVAFCATGTIVLSASHHITIQLQLQFGCNDIYRHGNWIGWNAGVLLHAQSGRFSPDHGNTNGMDCRDQLLVGPQGRELLMLYGAMSRRGRARGFTLIELMVGMGITAFLLMMVMPSIQAICSIPRFVSRRRRTTTAPSWRVRRHCVAIRVWSSPCPIPTAHGRDCRLRQCRHQIGGGRRDFGLWGPPYRQ